MPKVLGINDDITVCDCCGKKNLRCTVALELDGGDIVHYGRDCAGTAVLGRKSRKNADLMEMRARARSRVEPVIAAIRAALPEGIEVAKAAGRAVLKDDWIWWERTSSCPEYHDFRDGSRRGLQVTITGYQSWGCIRVTWTGGEERIEIMA